MDSSQTGKERGISKERCVFLYTSLVVTYPVELNVCKTFLLEIKWSFFETIRKCHIPLGQGGPVVGDSES